MPDVVAAVRELRDRGFAVCRIRPGEKSPMHPEWPVGSLEAGDFTSRDSVGIVCGWPSTGNREGHALMCVDIDHLQAVTLADQFLPPTGMVEGRAGKPRSHRWYLVPIDRLSPDETSTAPLALAGAVAASRHPGPRSRRVSTSDGKEAIALKGTGGQAVVPPSLHHTGERREWDGGVPGEPAVVEYADLLGAVGRLGEAIGGRPLKGFPTRMVGRETIPTQGRHVVRPEDLRLLIAAEGCKSVTVQGHLFSFETRVLRAKAYLARVPDDGLSQSGSNGHDTLYKHARLVTNDFLVRDRDTVLRLFDEYNARLVRLASERPDEGFEPWSADELSHKVDDALDGGFNPDYPPACKLTTPAAECEQRLWNDPARLADEYLERHVVQFMQGSAYRYTGAAYEEQSGESLSASVRLFAEGQARAEYERERAAVRNELMRMAQPDAESPDAAAHAGRMAAVRRRRVVVPPVAKGLVADVIEAIRARRQLPDSQELDRWLGDERRPPVLAVSNGLLDLRTRTLHPPSNEWFSTTVLPATFDPAAPAPERFLCAVRRWTQGDPQLGCVLQELAGACLDASLQLKFFAMLAGEGNNGKSVFLVVLRTLLGAKNVAAVPIDELVRNRFSSYALLGKLANLVGDQGFVELADEGRLKTLTGGDQMAFERKHRDVIHAVNRAKIILSANTLPSISDKSEAVWRREVVVPFDAVISPAEIDPRMLDSEYWRPELSGILNWAIEGLARLHRVGSFTPSPRSEAAKAKHRRDSNPAREFLEFHYAVSTAEVFVSTVDLYQEYRKWCEKTGRDKPLVLNNFAREIPRCFPRIRAAQPRQPEGLRPRGYYGLIACNPESTGAILTSDAAQPASG